MRKPIRVVIVTLSVIACSKSAFAQAMGEYGRLLGDSGVIGKSIEKGPSGKSLPESSRPKGSNPPPRAGNTLPPFLTVSVNNAVIYARSEDWSDKVGEVPLGEKVKPLLQSNGPNAVWYMVKTESGTTGWINAADVTSYQQKTP